MVFVKYKTKDYAEWQLLSWISSWALSLQVKSWEWSKFPTLWAGEKFIWTLEKRTWTTVTAKERVLVTARSTDTFTITRSFWGDTAISFSGDDYFCLHVNSDIIIDIQDEISLKLARAWMLRTWNWAWKISYNNWSWDETELALWSANTYLKSNWPSSAPSWTTPPLDIEWQTEITPEANDFWVFYDLTWTVNWKALIARIAWMFALTFWNWSDGNVSISWTVTLSRDMYYNDLTVPAWAVLDPNWYRIFIKWKLSWAWTIGRNWNNWNNASWATAWTAWAVLNQWSLNAEVSWWNWANGFVNPWAYFAWTAWNAWWNANPSLVNVNGVAWWAWWYAWTGWSAWTSTRWSLYNTLWFTLLHPATAVSSPVANYLSIAWSWWWGWWACNAVSWSSWWGWWAGWNGWLIWLSVAIFDFTWTISATWWTGGNGWNWSWTWIIWWGWGWWWGNWWTLLRIYWIIVNEATITLTWGNWWTWWTWASWNWVAWTAWNSWTNISIKLY